jgi:hypothetical protein
MATIIDTDNPTTNRSVLVDSSDSSAGWAVAVLILVALIVAGAFWYMRAYRAPAAANNPGSTIQVNLPTSGTTGGDTNNAQPTAPNSNTNTNTGATTQ